MCAFDKTLNNTDDKTCKSITAYDEVVFRALDYCHSGSSSCTVGFVVDVTFSKLKCAGGHGNLTRIDGVNELHFSEADCRYPDQIRLDIYSEFTARSGSSALAWRSALAALIFGVAATIF